jgi:hypothetical protein
MQLIRAEMDAIEREAELTAQLEEVNQRYAQKSEQVKEMAALREENQRCVRACVCARGE